MGWGIDFKADIFLSRMNFDGNKYQVEDAINSIEEDLVKLKIEIYMYAAATPKDVCPEDWEEENISFLRTRLDELFEEYDGQIVLLDHLKLYLETLQEKV